MELVIAGKAYPLKASFSFLRKIEKAAVRNVNGESLDFGLANAIIQFQEAGDLRYLVDLLMALNTGLNPQLKKDELEKWLEEECEDPDALGDEVIDFLSKANVCKGRLKKLGLLTKSETSIKA